MAARKIGFAPIADRHSRILILGTFPSLLSRQDEGYYANPRNAFWPILFQLYPEIPGDQFDYQDKKDLLLRHGIALWDIVESCEIEGSADTEIRDPRLIDLQSFLREHPGIRQVCFNGSNAARFAKKCGELPVPCVTLPSTSPANAQYSVAKKMDIWRKIILEEESD